MRQLAPHLHHVDVPFRFLGLQIGTRMTVLQLEGGLLLISPVKADPETVEAVEALGEPRWVLAPNKLHHLFVRPWIRAGLEAWAAPGLPEKRSDCSFQGVIERGTSPFGSEVELLPLACFPFSNEVVVLHRPSGTLIVQDLVFHFTAEAPLLTRIGMTLSGAHPGCCASVLERVGMKRDVARRELGEILDRDFDRLVMAHGTVIERGGKDALRGAYRWLGL